MNLFPCKRVVDLTGPFSVLIPQLSLVAVKYVLLVLQVTIAVVEGWEQS